MDRRLRESRREVALASPPTREASSADVWVELACLEIKYASAAHLQQRVLGQRISADRRETLAPLADRIHRNATAALDAIQRAAAARNPAPRVSSAGWLSQLGRSSGAVLKRSRRPRLIGLAAVALVFLTVVYVSLPDAPPSAGVLSGVPPLSSVAGPAPAGADTPPLGGSPSPSFPATIAEQVAMDFDDHRIGPFAAAGWGHVASVVAVVAYPTPFDRSIAVTTTDANPAETCFAVDEAVRLLSFGVELAVDDAKETVATVTLRDETAGPRLVVTVDATRSFATSGDGTAVASGEGVAEDTWYSLRVRELAGDVVVDLTSESQELPIATGSVEGPLRVASICLGVSGAADAAAHYDNLRLDYERSSA